MMVGWCSPADAAAATARAAVGRTAVASKFGASRRDGVTGQMTGQGRRPRDSCVRKEGILPPSAAARTSWVFAHPVTSQVMKRTGVTLPWTMDSKDEGRKRAAVHIQRSST